MPELDIYIAIKLLPKKFRPNYFHYEMINPSTFSLPKSSSTDSKALSDIVCVASTASLTIGRERETQNRLAA